jgi:hypothetical protein
MTALLSDDAERVREALKSPDPALAAFVIPLLARHDVAAPAMEVLGGFSARITGQLADALLDPSRSSPSVRRRLARIIGRGSSIWAAAGLLAAVDDPDYSVRSEVLRGIRDIQQRGVTLPVTREALLMAAKRELERSDCPPNRPRAELALLLLGLAFDREAFHLASKALASEDEWLRGTALEYLDNVVPEPIRSLLLARLPVAKPAKSLRFEQELLADLRRTVG